VAALFLRHADGLGLWAALGGSMALAFAGSLAWSVEGTPAGRLLIWLCGATLATALMLASRESVPLLGPSWLFATDLTAAALLGTATTAMLLGHSYLIAPGMSIAPLLRALAALGTAIVLRGAVAGVALWSWTAEHSLTNLNDEAVLWLPVRWGLGLIGPLVLGVMAWQTARIRSTQSATGILYVVVIFCFLGELTSQLLSSTTHHAL
jgi:hypothetical protein